MSFAPSFLFFLSFFNMEDNILVEIAQVLF